MRKQTPLGNVRKSRTLNQAQMATVLKISQQHYSKIESGRVAATPDLRVRIAAILGVSVSDVFEAEQEAAGA
jgi:DNA-binding XRE family transcriptional regulator